MARLTVALLSLALIGCSPEPDKTSDPTLVVDPTPDPIDPKEPTDTEITCDSVDRANCVEIAAGDSAALQDAVNTLEDDSAIVLAEGTYVLDNQVTVRGSDGFTLIGQGIDVTILDFSTQMTQANGVDIVGDDVHVEGFTIHEAQKDGLRIEESDGVVIRAIKANWENENDSTNGAYGLYPVRVSHVLMEDSEAYNASDAGIYVGQCQHAIVRNNTAMRNVAGIEIENTQFADVYGNHAEDNTGGLVVFDLPGNPVVGRDVLIRDNTIVRNNRENFASPGTTVALIPPGTGTFAMASRRIEITGNTFDTNDTADIALLSGFIVDGNPASWYVPNADLIGDISGIEAELFADADGIHTFRTFDVYVHDNTHAGSGTSPYLDIVNDPDNPANVFGLLHLALGGPPLGNVLYDAIGESMFSATDAVGNSNDNRICVVANEGVNLMSIDLEAIDADINQYGPRGDVWISEMLYQPAAPFAPFDCVGPALIGPDSVDQ